MSGLSTKHVVLGLLIERPGYGYDLTKRMEARLGFLGLADTGIYGILDRLEDDGWIARVGDPRSDRTRRGAARVMYAVTPAGEDEFGRWLRSHSDRGVLRDELQAKLVVAPPGDLPELLSLAEEQHRACLAELASLSRPSLARAAQPDVPWEEAAVMMVDDFRVRLLQSLVDWLDAIGTVIEERIERARPAI